MFHTMPPFTLLLKSALRLQVKYHYSQMYLLYNWVLLSRRSELYWNHQPWQKLIMDSWKWWQETHIEKRQKLLHIHISQNKLTDIVSWPPYFPYLCITNGVELFQPSLFILRILKIIPGWKNLVLQKYFYTLSLCGHTSADFYWIGGGGKYLPK